MKAFYILLLFLKLATPSFATEAFDSFLYDLEEDLIDLFRITNPVHIAKEDLKELAKVFTIEEHQIESRIGLPNLKQSAICFACKKFSNHILYSVKNTKLGAPLLTTLLKAICGTYIKLSTFTKSNFCSDLVKLNLPILLYIVKNSKIISDDLICSVLLQKEECYEELPQLTWNISLPRKESYVKKPSIENTQIKIVHLTDPHISADYEEGSVANCNFPVCCKRNLGNSKVFLEKAGKWGNEEYCDIPFYLYTDTLDHIRAAHTDTQFFYFTGDIIDHTVWEATVENNSELIQATFDSLHKRFADLKIIPTIGNHEAVPLNIYPPPYITDPKFSQQWLYELLANLWGQWLPESAVKTIARQGYYTVSLKPYLRAIVLNNNICYIYNWWLLYDTDYLKEQLYWLVDVLTSAEKNGELVHILTHVPTGNRECIQPWEYNYNRIITRFEHIITGQFVGHTHTDEIKVFYNEKTGKPNNVVFNGASLTTYLNFGPNYKIYTLDPKTTEVLDSDTYTFNMTNANMHPSQSLPWYKLYSMRKAFGLKDLSPKSIDILAKKLYDDESLLYQYFRFYVRDGDPSLKQGCDKDCQKEILCKIVTTAFLNNNHALKDYCD